MGEQDEDTGGQDAPPKSTIEQIVEDASRRIEESQARASAAITSASESVAAAERRATEATQARDAAEARERQARADIAAANDRLAQLERELQEAKDAAARVPGGDPGRQGMDLAGLSAVNKIRVGLEGRRSGGGN